ncbi:MAG: response regulator [Lachnospiraceae bacterium]|nr:response regulator [Lachnospiraceae bacterium]
MQNIQKKGKVFLKIEGTWKEGSMQAANRACRRIVAFTICLILILSNFITVAADDGQANNRTVKAGIFYFEGYHMKDEEGRLTGYGIEFLDLVSEYSHLNFQYTGYDNSWSDMLTMLENGEIDIVTSARRTEEREERFAFSVPIGRNNTVLSTRADNTQLHSGDYKTYGGMTVGQLTGSSQNQSLVEFAEEKGFSYRTKEYNDSDALVAALQDGEIDAILSSDLRKAENEKTLDIIAEDNFYAIVRKDDMELLNEINYAIEQMDQNEGDWKNELYYRYYGPVYSSELIFTEREKAYIQEVVSGEKKITVTALGDREPYSYVENGELKGILPDYFACVMEMAGLPYEIVIPEDREDYNTMADTNGVDVVIDRLNSGAIMEEAAYRGFRTDVYMTTGVARVTRQDFVGDIKRIAVSDSQSGITISQKFHGDFEILNYSTREAAMQAVLDREVDAAYVYAYSAQLFVNRDTTDSLYYSIANDMNLEFQMYVRDSTDHELITILNKCIQHMSNDMVNQLVLKYTSYTMEDMNLLQYMQANPKMMLIVVLAITLIICIILVLYLRGRWSRRLLDTTERSNRVMKEQLAIVETLSRDYTNVFAINEESGTARIIKLEGYVTEGLKKDSKEEQPYAPILNQYIQDRVHPEDQEYLAQALSLDKVREQISLHGEYMGSYRIQSDGEDHYFQYTYVKVGESVLGKDSFILAGFRNIDEVIRKEQEQKAVLSEALAQAQHANNAKTTFLNNMSHDIRTPMNAIIGFATIAASHINNKDQVKDCLQKVLSSSNHLLSLINDILDMSRIESGKVQIKEQECNLSELIHNLVNIIQPQVKAKQLELFIDTCEVANEDVMADGLKLNQVFINLMSNAVKYTPAGGTVSFRIMQKTTFRHGYGDYVFIVKDNGIGMSPEFVEHIFEPFERESNVTQSGIEGTGLGMAITKNIVEMMNGAISVESEPGKGSIFTVELTLRLQDVEKSAAQLKELEGLRALVVDDDLNVCDSVSKMLKQLGMRSEWTTSGREAAYRAQTAHEEGDPYHTYIIDWQMPEVSGVETARKIRSMVGADVPIIILTAYDWSDIEEEAKTAGVTGFCAKPLFMSDLKSALLAANNLLDKEEEAAVWTKADFEGKRILLVEDIELNREIAEVILTEAGFVVESAPDGTDAVAMVEKSAENYYDAVLMDIQMPIMNGYEATRTIRNLSRKDVKDLPIIAMTANAMEEDKEAALMNGMNAHLSKPVDIDLLIEVLEQYLK